MIDRNFVTFAVVSNLALNTDAALKAAQRRLALRWASYSARTLTT